MEPEFAYIARRPCGCITFAASEPLRAEAIVGLAECVEMDLSVERVPIEDVREGQWTCKKRHPDLRPPLRNERAPGQSDMPRNQEAGGALGFRNIERMYQRLNR